MTTEEAIKVLQSLLPTPTRGDARSKEHMKFSIALLMAIEALKQEPNIGHCKECKYFEYDSVAIVDGIPLIVAHEICKKWGDGCKTKENGYCFLFEPKEKREEEE